MRISGTLVLDELISLFQTAAHSCLLTDPHGCIRQHRGRRSTCGLCSHWLLCCIICFACSKVILGNDLWWSQYSIETVARITQNPSGDGLYFITYNLSPREVLKAWEDVVVGYVGWMCRIGCFGSDLSDCAWQKPVPLQQLVKT